MTEKFIVYGSGDGGSHELRAMILRKGYRCEFRDIRKAVNLEFINKSNHTTVPQMYDGDTGKYIGDYDKSAELIGTLTPLRAKGGGVA